MPKKHTINLAHFLYEVGTLRKVARAHRQTLLTDDLSDSIASHSYRTTMIGFFLAQEEGADVSKVVLMCLFHDTAEARSGDQNWVHKKYVKVFEDEILRDQLKGLPNESTILDIVDEYSERKTNEAKIAKDADLIDQILLLNEYKWTGNNEATRWLVGNEQEKLLHTKSAKDLAREIEKQKPSDWWKNIWTSERRK